DRPVPADEVLEFGVLYRQNCAGCHGADGKLGPAPPLNDALFRAIVPQEELVSIVSKGRSKTLMPAFGNENGGTLTAVQIQVLVAGNAAKNAINDPVFLNLNSDQVLRRYVITGRPDFGMPGFAEARPGDSHFQALSNQEIADLVALLASWRQTTVTDK